MLRIYDDILEWLGSLPPILQQVAGSDANLAGQLRRASTSVGLNVAEGMGATGRMRLKAYRIALAEMREAVGALDIAVRLLYIEPLSDRDRDRTDKIVATLVKLARPRAR